MLGVLAAGTVALATVLRRGGHSGQAALVPRTGRDAAPDGMDLDMPVLGRPSDGHGTYTYEYRYTEISITRRIE